MQTLFNLIINKIEPDEEEIIISKKYKIGVLEEKILFNHSTVLDEIISVLTDERIYEAWKGKKILFGLEFSTEEILLEKRYQDKN